MIFKYSTKEIKEYRDSFYSEIEKLFYPKNAGPIKELKKNVDPHIYSDVISAFSRKMFEKGMLNSQYIKDTLRSYQEILQSKGFVFKGEMGSFKDDYGKEYNFKEHTYERLKKCLDDFKPNEKDTNFFFIAGCQNLEMLDLRVEKATILLAGLFNFNKINIKNTHLILSGWNNSGQQGFKKVSFTNESMIMKNLLMLKLQHYLGEMSNGKRKKNDLEGFETFVQQHIITETKSKNSLENIRGLNREIQKVIFKKENDKSVLNCEGKVNLFIVSSTFHLSQLWDDSKKALLDFETKKYPAIYESSKRSAKVQVGNIYLVGSENENHVFKSVDGHIIKFIIQKQLQEGIDK